MTHDEAISKAIKLLRLSQSSNANEAALAAGKAQEIMDRYKLGKLSADFEANGEKEEEIKDFGFDPLELSARVSTWKNRLILTVAKLNQCKAYLTGKDGKKGFAIVGRPSDVTTVRYFYQWLKSEVDRLTKRDCAGTSVTYRNNFRIGVVETVVERLKAQRQSTDQAVKEEAAQDVANPLAVMRINNALAKREQQLESVNEWCRSNLNLHKVRISGGRHDITAREAGKRAGHEVRIQPTRGHIA